MMPKFTKFKLREYLDESGELDAFIELENKLTNGLARGAMLSGSQCHLVLMAFAWGQGVETSLAKLFDDRGKVHNGEKLLIVSHKDLKMQKNRCLHRHKATGTRCILDLGHDGRHHYRCAGKDCPGFPWPASEMQHPPSCARVDDSSLDAGRDALSACSCGSPRVEISFPFNLPADAGIDPTGNYQHAYCQTCGRKGPEKQSIQGAILAWNIIMMNEASTTSQKDREEKGSV